MHGQANIKTSAYLAFFLCLSTKFRIDYTVIHNCNELIDVRFWIDSHHIGNKVDTWVMRVFFFFFTVPFCGPQNKQMELHMSVLERFFNTKKGSSKSESSDT